MVPIFRLAVLAYLLLPLAALAQNKVESSVAAQLKSAPLTRVLIVTRPDPEKPNGGMSISSPSAYVASALGGHATNVRSIGGLPVTSAEINATALGTLRHDPNVLLVTRDIPMPPVLMDSVPFIGGDKVHQLGFRGTDRSVAVLDTGVQFDHPAFTDAIVKEACFSTPTSNVYKVTSLCPNAFDMSSLPGAARGCPANIDGCEHGTHVAGIVAGRNMSFAQKNFEGVAPGAKIVAVQVFTLFEGTDVCRGAPKCVLSFTSDQLRALDWVFKNRDELRIAAVNMSLGSGYHDTPCDGSSPLTEIIERLRAKGLPTVIAAGNDAFNDGIAEPACVSSAVSVAATKKDGSLDVAYSNVSTLVHIAAPGTDIVSSVVGSNYATLSGTSMAAPHVAAALALLRQEYPNDTALQLEQRLTTGAPLTTDPRTGTKLLRLELSHAAAAGATIAGTGAGLSGPAAAPTPPQPTAPTVPSVSVPASGSFIVRTERAATELEAILGQNCRDLSCKLKAIGKNTYKLDVNPGGQMSPDERVKFNMDASDVHQLLNKDPATQVYDNRLSLPLQAR
jgi:Subtilase family